MHSATPALLRADEPIIECRRARPADIAGIVRLGKQALEESPMPGLRISVEKMQDMARECISSASNYAAVCTRNGVVVGAITVLVHPMLFYERNQASVVQFYCKDAPGEGIKLIRMFLRWAKERRAIRLICFTLEGDADPRIGKLLARLGLKSEMPVYAALRENLS